MDGRADPTTLDDDDVALALGRRDLKILAQEKELAALRAALPERHDAEAPADVKPPKEVGP